MFLLMLKLNAALKEAIGDELGTTIHSETFTYDKSIDGYKYIVEGDMSTSGLCLNIDDLKYEDERYVVKFTYCLPNEQDYYEGTIESLDRYQVTLEFLLNENGTYTKYQLLNIGSVEPKKIENNKSDELNKTNTNTISNTTIISNTNTSTNTNKNTNTIANTISSTNTTSNTIANTNIEHQHDYRIIAAEETGEYHTTIYGTHTLRCTICGDEVQESHRFGKWYTINSGTAWTLWCEDCRQYVYTTDYDFVKNHLEYGMNSIINNTSTKPNYDPSTVNNYASTMNWTEHWAPGLKFQYPTEWDLSTTPKNVGNGLTVNADVNGWAIGKNPDTGEIIESSVLIEVYDQVIAFGNTPEEAYQNFADTYKFEENTGCYYTNNNGDEWHEFWNYGYFYDDMAGDIYYVHASALWDGGEPSGRYVIDIVRIATDNKNNFKVTNITNKIIGSLKTTSK